MSSLINIDSSGYGKIYKAAMRNKQLPLIAKSIYAYFCSYAGNGNQAFPKRDKIVRDLNINKDTFTKHLNFLVSNGYIAKERTAVGNLYAIMKTVSGYDEDLPQPKDEETDKLIMENVASQGFGTVPKLVMLDSRLTAQAKAIYAYFASFAGAGTTAFPRRSTIIRDLNLAPATYYSHFNLLLSYGYLTVEHRKNNGRFDVSIYRLSEHVDSHDSHHKRKQQTISEKAVYDKNEGTSGNFIDKGDKQIVMSEKSSHDKLLKTSMPLSEKTISEKTVYGNFGQANIKNKNIINSFYEKEHVYNHQGGTGDNEKSIPLFSSSQAKELMRYNDLRCDMLAWGDLKQMLGHFASPRDKARYIRKITEILDESVLQTVKQLNTSSDPRRIADILLGESFSAFFERAIERWDEIRSPKGYVCASFKNMLNVKMNA